MPKRGRTIMPGQWPNGIRRPMSTWILLRGLTRETGHWGDFIDIFRRNVPGARVEALDLPGNGTLNRLASPCAVPAMADHCRAALARRGITPPYNLLAMSLGAMVAVSWASTAPREIARCVLINTSLRPLSPFFRRLQPANYPHLLGLLMPGMNDRDKEAAILRMTSRMRPADESVLQAWTALRSAHPVTRMNAVRQLCAAMRYRAPSEPPAAQLLILASRNDALVHPDCSQALADKWRCEIRFHPRAGHDIPLDDGAWLAGQVTQWLAGPSR